MWWHSLIRQPKFIDKVQYCSFVQHLFVCNDIAKPMWLLHNSTPLKNLAVECFEN
jgi:hypothetical protein